MHSQNEIPARHLGPAPMHGQELIRATLASRRVSLHDAAKAVDIDIDTLRGWAAGQVPRLAPSVLLGLSRLLWQDGSVVYDPRTDELTLIKRRPRT